MSALLTTKLDEHGVDQPQRQPLVTRRSKMALRLNRLLQEGLRFAVGLLVGCVAFLAVQLLAHLLFTAEDLLGGPARVVLAMAVVAGVLVAWLFATNLSRHLRGLPDEVGFVVLLLVLFHAVLVGEWVLPFLRDPDWLLRSSN